MKQIFFVVFSILSMAAKAQIYQPEKVSKKAIDLYERGMQKLQDEQEKDGIPYLKKAIEVDGNYADAILSLAGVYGALKDYKSSVEYFERGRALDTNYFRFYYLPYSIN